MGSGWFYSIGAIGLGCCSVVLVFLVFWGIYCNYMCSLTISLSWALYKNTNFTHGANSTSLHDPFYPTEAAPWPMTSPDLSQCQATAAAPERLLHGYQVLLPAQGTVSAPLNSRFCADPRNYLGVVLWFMILYFTRFMILNGPRLFSITTDFSAQTTRINYSRKSKVSLYWFLLQNIDPPCRCF